jgi:hypothetical protein
MAKKEKFVFAKNPVKTRKFRPNLKERELIYKDEFGNRLFMDTDNKLMVLNAHDEMVNAESLNAFVMGPAKEAFRRYMARAFSGSKYLPAPSVDVESIPKRQLGFPVHFFEKGDRVVYDNPLSTKLGTLGKIIGTEGEYVVVKLDTGHIVKTHSTFVKKPLKTLVGKKQWR